MSGWALTDDVIEKMIERLDQLLPSVVLECGSGVSTVHLARWAARTGATVVSLEHESEFYEQTKGMVDGEVDLRHAPLVNGFYNTPLPQGIDFVLIDGPPGRGIGRSRVLPRIWGHLSQDFEVWLDDANRAHEQSCIDSWTSMFDIDVRVDTDGKGLAVITRAV